MTSKRWQLPKSAPESFLGQFPGFLPAIPQLLWNRGIRNREDAERFLGPDWERDTYSESLFRNMPAAVARVFRALEGGEAITVHGDYDADGVCGSAVLVSTLRDICRAFGFDEKTISSFIPDREKDGYGVSVATVETLHAERGTRLIVTVDCGISNKPAIDRGRELGIDAVVCDHHAMPAELPESAILIHPQVPGETYPNKSLCGTGVAYKLACGLIAEARARWDADGRRRTSGAPNPFPNGHEKWLLDLVAIATVTDVMPLVGENRALEAFGLLVLNKTRRPGLRRLVDVAGGKLGTLDTYSVGFQIGPRINAAGRMRHADEALRVLLEEDDLRAAVLANELNDANVSRQKASDAMYRDAVARLGDPTGRTLLIVHADGWSPGLVGLVAGKLVSLHGRPVYVVGKQGEKYVGSGRSVPGFDVTACMRAAAEHFDKFGGHPQACGFSVTGDEKFALACAAMEAYAERELAGRDLVPVLPADVEIPLEDASWDLLEQVGRFAPFGEGNPKPVFVSRGVSVSAVSTVGADGKHLRLSVSSPRGKLAKAIGFGLGPWAQRLRLGDRVDVAYEVGMNEWNGNKEFQLRLVDVSEQEVVK